jgi:hypothetical protein
LVSDGRGSGWAADGQSVLYWTDTEIRRHFIATGKDELLLRSDLVGKLVDCHTFSTMILVISQRSAEAVLLGSFQVRRPGQRAASQQEKIMRDQSKKLINGKKLSLSKETLRQLADKELNDVAGGARTGKCPTTGGPTNIGCLG